MRDLEACKIGDNLYLCSQCGSEVDLLHFNRHYSLCSTCEDENGARYDDGDYDDDYYDDLGDDD